MIFTHSSLMTIFIQFLILPSKANTYRPSSPPLILPSPLSGLNIKPRPLVQRVFAVWGTVNMRSQKEHLAGCHKACWDWTRGRSDLSLHVESQECHCVGFTHSSQ